MHEEAFADQATRSLLNFYGRAMANSTAQFQCNINALNAIGNSIQANNTKSVDTAARTVSSYLEFTSSVTQLSLRYMAMGRETTRKAVTFGHFSDQMTQFNKVLTRSASEMMESALTAAPKTSTAPSAPAASLTETEH